MNKIKKILTLGLAFGVFAGGIAAIANSRGGEMKKTDAIASDVEWDYLAYDGNNFEITTYDGSTWHDINFFRANRTDSAFFDGGQRSFNALDDFFNGVHDEGWRGELKSATWTQKDDYVTFTLGGRNSVVKFYTASDDEEIAGATVDSDDYFQDPKLSFNMIVRVVDLSYYKNQLLYLKVFDVETGNIGAVTFGALKVSQSAEDVARTISVHKNHLSHRNPDGEDWRKDSLAREYTLAKYNDEAEYAPFKSIVLTDANMDFEDYDQCTNLALDNSTVTGFADRGAGYDSLRWGYNEAYTLGDYWGWDQRMPFNKQGNAFFKGEYGGDGAKYTLLTNDFKLSGTGYISIKLAGAGTKVAVVKVSDGSEISFTNTKFSWDEGKYGYNVAFGSRTNTMTRYVLDASAFKNEIVRIAISDDSTAGWSILMFDELVTYYEELSDIKFPVDRFDQPYVNGFDVAGSVYETRHEGTYYGVIKTELVSNHDDAVKEAKEFIDDYYDLARDVEEGNPTNMCSVITSDDMKTLITRYKGLSADAKAIVNASGDFNQVSGETVWYRVNPTVSGLEDSIIYIGNKNGGMYAFESGNLLSIVSTDSRTMIIVAISTVIALIAFGLAFHNKKKKANR